MDHLLVYAAVAALSGVGALMRFLVDAVVSERISGRLPIGTGIVNLTGAASLGLLAGLAAGRGAPLLLGVALVGSYSTFSTWMLECLAMAEAGRPRAATVNVVGQTALGLVAAGAGWAVGAAL